MKKKDLTVILCSWQNAEMLKATVESLEGSFETNAKITVALNEGDTKSQKYLTEKKIEFVNLPNNRGTQAVDYVFPFIEGDYVCNVNDDMLFVKGWDKELIEIIEKNYPASSSCFLVEPQSTGNPVVVVDDEMEKSFIKDNPDDEDYRKSCFVSPKTRELFEEKFRRGAYKLPHKMVNYTHPIMTRTSDFFEIGGYSANFDFGWWPGYGLDDNFALRLALRHNESGGFRFIVSDKYPVYHAMSLTNAKIPQEQRDHCHGMFEKCANGYTLIQFIHDIQRGKWLLENEDGSVEYPPPLIYIPAKAEPIEDNE